MADEQIVPSSYSQIDTVVTKQIDSAAEKLQYLNKVQDLRTTIHSERFFENLDTSDEEEAHIGWIAGGAGGGWKMATAQPTNIEQLGGRAFNHEWLSDVAKLQLNHTGILEVGVHKGTSLAELAKIPHTKLIGIDHYPEMTEEERDAFVAEHVTPKLLAAKPDYAGTTQFIYENSANSEAVKLLDDKSLSFAHIDGPISYSGLSATIRELLPKFQDDCIIAIDNFCARHIGVMTAIIDFCLALPEYRKIYPFAITVGTANTGKMYCAASVDAARAFREKVEERYKEKYNLDDVKYYLSMITFIDSNILYIRENFNPTLSYKSRMSKLRTLDFSNDPGAAVSESNGG